jgi:hypothetical protein
MYALLSSYGSFLVPKEHYDEPFTILIKFPSRSRPQKLIDTYQIYITMAERPDLIHTLITLDQDDPTATDQLIQSLTAIHPRTKVVIGASAGKIGAVNRDMEQAGSYDILLLASDDMIPVQKGYDEIIRRHMKEWYPDRDGVLWYNDGYQGRNLNTLCILGKPYYDRFGYIYHPSYKSLYSDNEFMEVANRLGKQTYIDSIIIRHEHPSAIRTIKKDTLYDENDKYHDMDRDTFMLRKRSGFQ